MTIDWIAGLTTEELVLMRDGLADLTKYSEDQARVPAGEPGGGEFAGGATKEPSDWTSKDDARAWFAENLPDTKMATDPDILSRYSWSSPEELEQMRAKGDVIGRMPLENLRQMGQAFARVLSLYPQVGLRVTSISIRNTGPRVYASWTGSRNIGMLQISPKTALQANAVAKNLERDVAAGYHPPGCGTFQSVIEHELGHGVGNWLGTRGGWQPGTVRVGDETFHINSRDPSPGRSGYGLYNSGYGMKNGAEWFAEQFAGALAAGEPLGPDNNWGFVKTPVTKVLKYSPDQERDERGRWTSGADEALAAYREAHPGTRAFWQEDAGSLKPEVGEALAALGRLQDRFPEIKISVIEMELLDRGVVAQYESGAIVLNQTYWSAGEDPDLEALTGSPRGFHPPGCATPEGYITHEFGHAVDEQTVWPLSWEGPLSPRAAILAAGGSGKISGYAAVSSLSNENFAEVFSAAYAPGSRATGDPRAEAMHAYFEPMAVKTDFRAATKGEGHDVSDEPRGDDGRWTAGGGESSEEDYRGQHRPPAPDYGAPLHAVNTNIYPDDVYDRQHQVQYYGTGDGRLDRQSFAIVNRVRDHPDEPVTIYRAVPKDVTGINAGDWVTINRDYAQMHLDGPLGGEGHILSQTVLAGSLFTQGDSIHEWGYWPDARQLPKGVWADITKDFFTEGGVVHPIRDSEGYDPTMLSGPEGEHARAEAKEREAKDKKERQATARRERAQARRDEKNRLARLEAIKDPWRGKDTPAWVAEREGNRDFKVGDKVASDDGRIGTITHLGSGEYARPEGTLTVRYGTVGYEARTIGEVHALDGWKTPAGWRAAGIVVGPAIPPDWGKPGYIAQEVFSERDRSGRAYGIRYDGRIPPDDPRIVKLREELQQAIDLNHGMEKDLGIKNVWSGKLILGMSSSVDKESVAAVKEWNCDIRLAESWQNKVVENDKPPRDDAYTRYLESRPGGYVRPDIGRTVLAHELAHGMSNAVGNAAFNDTSGFYQRIPGYEEGTVELYSRAFLQVQDRGPDASTRGSASSPTAWAYQKWADGIEAVHLETVGMDHLLSRTTGEQLSWYRDLLKVPLGDRPAWLNDKSSERNITLTGTSFNDMGYRWSSKAEKATGTPVMTGAEADAALRRTAEHLAAHPEDWETVGREAEVYWLISTAARREKAQKYSDEPRDEGGRWTDGGGEGGGDKPLPEKYSGEWYERSDAIYEMRDTVEREKYVGDPSTPPGTRFYPIDGHTETWPRAAWMREQLGTRMLGFRFVSDKAEAVVKWSLDTFGRGGLEVTATRNLMSGGEAVRLADARVAWLQFPDAIDAQGTYHPDVFDKGLADTVEQAIRIVNSVLNGRGDPIEEEATRRVDLQLGYRSKAATVTKAGPATRLASGGKRRDTSLNPIVARTKAALQALAAEHKTDPNPLVLSDSAKALLYSAYLESMQAGYDDSGADPEMWDEQDAEATADDKASSMLPWLIGLGALLMAGGLSDAMLDSRMGQYAATLNPVYEQGFAQGAGAQGTITSATWHTEEDGTVCDLCEERDGQVWYGDEEHPYPGDGGYGGDVCDGGPNCFPGDTLVAGRITGAFRMQYSGPVCDLVTASGRALTVTPNHPILTTRGWVRAGMLHEGDEVFSETVGIGEGASDHAHHDPATADEVFDLLSEASAVRARLQTRPGDFYGDAVGGDGHVDVVGADSVLRHGIDSASDEGSRQAVLKLAAMQSTSLTGDGTTLNAVARITTPTAGGPGGAEETDGILSLPADTHRFGAISQVDTVATEQPFDSPTSGTDLAAKLSRGGPRLIATDKVVHNHVRQFEGHVYDLQTSVGWHTANGILTSNCRCELWYDIVPADEAEGIGAAGALAAGTAAAAFASDEAGTPEVTDFNDWAQDDWAAWDVEAVATGTLLKIAAFLRAQVAKVDVDATDGPIVAPGASVALLDDAALVRMYRQLTLKYSDDQPRDEGGRWTSGDGAGVAGGRAQLNALLDRFPGPGGNPIASVYERPFSDPKVQGQTFAPNPTSLTLAGRARSTIEIDRKLIEANTWTPAHRGWDSPRIPKTVATVITHEFGHAVENLIYGIMGSSEPPRGLQQEWNNTLREVYTHPTSGYARADGTERWAEAFSAAYSPGSKATEEPGPRAVRDFMDAHWGDVTAAWERMYSWSKVLKYSEDQPRDERGRFTGSGGGDFAAAHPDVHLDPALATLDPDRVRLALGALDRVMRDYPGVQVSRITTETDPGTSGSARPWKSEIVLSRDAWSRPIPTNAVAPDKTTGGPIGTAVHEWGHLAYDRIWGILGADRMWSLLNSLPDITGTGSPNEKFAEWCVVADNPASAGGWFDPAPAEGVRQALRDAYGPSKAASATLTKYSEDQPRDDHGRFAGAGMTTTQEGFQQKYPDYPPPDWRLPDGSRVYSSGSAALGEIYGYAHPGGSIYSFWNGRGFNDQTIGEVDHMLHRWGQMSPGEGLTALRQQIWDAYHSDTDVGRLLRQQAAMETDFQNVLAHYPDSHPENAGFWRQGETGRGIESWAERRPAGSFQDAQWSSWDDLAGRGYRVLAGGIFFVGAADDHERLLINPEAKHAGGQPDLTKYSPDQERDEAGRWTTEGGERLRPLLDPNEPPRARSGPIVDHHRAALPFATNDPTRMENLPQSHRDAILARLTTDEKVASGKKEGQARGFPGMTVERMQDNLRSVLGRGLADPVVATEGKAWYGAARGFGQNMADQQGYSLRQAVGIIAGMSPQQEWGSNAATADYVGRAIKEDPVVHLTDQGLAEATKELAGRGSSAADLEGHRLSELDPMRAAAALKAMGKADGVSFINDAGKREGARWTCGLPGISDAIRIARGEAPDDVLGGHKVRSFYNNILLGSTGDVTIDTHAISAAMGEKVTSQDARMTIMDAPALAEYGTEGAYPIIADAYRTVAAENGLSPEQAQAIIWLQWRIEHP